MGVIPDWQPVYYQPDEIQLPHFIPDTWTARQDVAAQYTTISRLDQGDSNIFSTRREFIRLLLQVSVLY